jgi:glycosyltransferase involved in cell wall biosynthesis
MGRTPVWARPAASIRVVGALVAAVLTVSGAARFRLACLGSRRSNLPSNPKVSVLLPTHNRADLVVNRSLRSIRLQTYRNLEILVCAHGCTDDTISRVNALGDPRVRVIEVSRATLGYPPSAENHWLVGPVRPLNAGTKASTGDFIAVIGDDDEWTEDHLAKSIEWLLRTGDDFVSSQTLAIDGAGKRTIRGGDFHGKVEVGSVSTWVYRATLRGLRWNIHSWRKGWNRPNDIDFVRRVRRVGARMSFMAHVGHVWSPRPGESELGARAYVKDPDKYEEEFGLNPAS